MTSTIDTAAALDAATVKLHAAVDRIAELQEQEAKLSNDLGEAIANDDADLASELKDKRGLIRDALDDLLYGRNALAQRADTAEKAHRDAQHAEHVKALKAASGKVLEAAEAFEQSLQSIKATRAQFVAAGDVLSRLAGSSRYSTTQLAEDLLGRRLWGRENPEYEAEVKTLLPNVEAI